MHHREGQLTMTTSRNSPRRLAQAQPEVQTTGQPRPDGQPLPHAQPLPACHPLPDDQPPPGSRPRPGRHPKAEGPARARANTKPKSQASPETVIFPRQYRLQYAACYAYSPKGESDVSQRSRQMCARVKNGSPKWLKTYVASVHQEFAQKRCFADYFSEHTLFVPVPQYLPSAPASLWVARRLAFVLQEAGLGAEVWTGLRRVISVEKSSSAWMWHRPTVQQHYQSFTVIPSPRSPTNIVIVDDVITKGRTFVAAALRLREAFPAATVRAFALVRTMGLVGDIDRLFDPCEGAIRWNGRDVHREP
jgi:hypothetical protein